MPGQDAYAVLDVGTTQLKAAFFSLDGHRLIHVAKELPLHAPGPGVAEQSPQAIWDAARLVFREAAMKSPSIRPIALAVTSERSTTFLTKRDGQSLTPALTWMDQRAGEAAKRVADRVNGRIGLGKISFLQEHHPQAWSRAERIHVPHSFLLERLTGHAVTDVVNALYLGGRSDGTYDAEILSELGIPQERLPQIRRGAEVAGPLTGDAARGMSLPPGIPVVVGSGDQQCSSLGLGVHRPGTAKATTGTGTFVNVPTDSAPFEFFDKDLKVFCTPRATGDGHLLEAVLPGTGSVYRWFRDSFYDPNVPFRQIDEEAAKVPAGAQGVHFHPLFPFSLGGFQRLGFHASRAHFARAILESSAYGTRFFLEVIKELGAAGAPELRLDGGGAASPLWRRIIAGATNRKCRYGDHVQDASALGAAVLCDVALGKHRTVEESMTALVRLNHETEPAPSDVAAYEREYPDWQSGFFTQAAGVSV